MYHPSRTALLLVALVALVAGDDDQLDCATYSCMPSSFPGFPDGLNYCASLTTRKDCLANSWGGLTTVSCAWRATTATALVDEFYVWGQEQTGNSYVQVNNVLPTDPMFSGYCALKSSISVPKSAVGNYYVVNDVNLGSSVTVESGCLVGLEGGKRECSSFLSFPPTAANTHAPGFTWLTIIFNPVTIPSDTTQLPVLMKNTYYLAGSEECGGDSRRRFSRRLAEEVSLRPWFRAFSIDQAILGGAANSLPSLVDLNLVYAPKGVVIGQLRNVISVKAKLRLVYSPKQNSRSVDKKKAPTQIAKAYLITQAAFYPYFQGATCTTSCPAPTDLAIASCTVDAKGRCSFEAYDLTESTYLIVASKEILGLNPTDPPVAVRLSVDAQYNPIFDPVPV